MLNHNTIENEIKKVPFVIVHQEEIPFGYLGAGLHRDLRLLNPGTHCPDCHAWCTTRCMSTIRRPWFMERITRLRSWIIFTIADSNAIHVTLPSWTATLVDAVSTNDGRRKPCLTLCNFGSHVSSGGRGIWKEWSKCKGSPHASLHGYTIRSAGACHARLYGD